MVKGGLHGQAVESRLSGFDKVPGFWRQAPPVSAADKPRTREHLSQR